MEPHIEFVYKLVAFEFLTLFQPTYYALQSDASKITSWLHTSSIKYTPEPHTVAPNRVNQQKHGVCTLNKRMGSAPSFEQGRNRSETCQWLINPSSSHVLHVSMRKNDQKCQGNIVQKELESKQRRTKGIRVVGEE